MKDGVKVIVLSGLTVAVLSTAGRAVMQYIRVKRAKELLEEEAFAKKTPHIMEE